MKHSPEHVAARAASKRRKAQERRDMPSNGTTWREQIEAGACLAVAAKAMRRSVWEGRRWADYLGLKWPDGRSQPEHKAAVSASRRRLFAEDDEFRAREVTRLAGFRPHLSPSHNRRLNMSEAELAQYDLITSKKYSADEAVLMIGRPDLTGIAMLARRDPDKAIARLMTEDAKVIRARHDQHRERTNDARP